MGCKILKNMVDTTETETISGIMKKTNTLDGKPLFRK